MTRARVSDILALTAKEFTVKVDSMKGSRGSRAVCDARLAVYYIARLNGHSGTHIGRMMGGRDPTTSCDGSRSCKAKMASDPKYRERVERILGKAAALPLFVMERREKIYRTVKSRQEPTKFDPDRYFKKVPSSSATNDDQLDDIEWLSRRVAAHYAEARA